MKKFISLVAAVVILFSLSSCRETEELSLESKEFENKSIVVKTKTDSLVSKTDTDQSNTPNTSNLEETDPLKDKIKW